MYKLLPKAVESLEAGLSSDQNYFLLYHNVCLILTLPGKAAETRLN